MYVQCPTGSVKKASEIDSVRICMLFCYEAQQCIISTSSTAVTYPLMPYFKHSQNRLHQYIEMNVNPYRKEDLRTMTPHQSHVPATTSLSPSLPPMTQKHHIHPSPEFPPSITSSSIPSQPMNPTRSVSASLHTHTYTKWVLHLQVHCPLGHAHELPQLQEHPGARWVAIAVNTRNQVN